MRNTGKRYRRARKARLGKRMSSKYILGARGGIRL